MTNFYHPHFQLNSPWDRHAGISFCTRGLKKERQESPYAVEVKLFKSISATFCWDLILFRPRLASQKVWLPDHFENLLYIRTFSLENAHQQKQLQRSIPLESAR